MIGPFEHIYLVTEIDQVDFSKNRYFIFPIGSYRQCIAFNPFFWGKNQYWRKSKEMTYHVKHLEETKELAKFGCPMSKNLLKRLDDTPPIKCVDFYDFLDKIGFDRKTKKYK
jgi:hypothetical protein